MKSETTMADPMRYRVTKGSGLWIFLLLPCWDI
jgi:hypothetical protein